MIAPTFLTAPAVALALCLASVAPAEAAAGRPDAVSAARLPAPVITTPTALSTQSSLFALSGTGIPGAHLNVEITDGFDVTQRSFFVQPDGTWATPSAPDSPLPPGRWRVTVTQDTGGAESPAATRVVRVGHTAGGPAAPVITATAGAIRFRLPARRLILRGTGTPGASVVVRLRLSFAKERLNVFIDAGLAAASGRWSVDLAADRRTTVGTGVAVPRGLRTPLGADRGMRLRSVLREAAAAAPAGSGGTDVVERFGVTAYQSDAAGQLSSFARPVQLILSEHLVAAPRITSPATGARLRGFTQVFSGTGVPRAVVSLAVPVHGAVSVGAEPIRVGRNGRWTRSIEFPRTGVWTVEAFQVTPDGRDSRTSRIRVTVLMPLPARPLLAGPGGTTDDPTPTLCGAGIPGARLRLLDNPTSGSEPGGGDPGSGDPGNNATTVGTTTVRTGGTWCATAVRLSRGSHTLTATQQVARLTSLPSASLRLTVE